MENLTFISPILESLLRDAKAEIVTEICGLELNGCEPKLEFFDTTLGQESNINGGWSSNSVQNLNLIVLNDHSVGVEVGNTIVGLCFGGQESVLGFGEYVVIANEIENAVDGGIGCVNG